MDDQRQAECRKCLQMKPIEDFPLKKAESPSPSRPNGRPARYDSTCYSCTNERDRGKIRKNPQVRTHENRQALRRTEAARIGKTYRTLEEIRDKVQKVEVAQTVHIESLSVDGCEKINTSGGIL
jgi:hypothetical protein